MQVAANGGLATLAAAAGRFKLGFGRSHDNLRWIAHELGTAESGPLPLSPGPRATFSAGFIGARDWTWAGPTAASGALQASDAK
jgi:hypothetical protein